MKLISAKIENYRIHKSLQVEFDESRTLIGGRNESGKSTLIEAIHRALFLRHSVGGDVQAGMVSTTHGGIPSVELTFEAGGTHYHLRKEFGGNKGRATLAAEGSQGLSGDEAEAELARILSTDGPITGHGAQSKLEAQWAHLWIWQGNSAHNPSQGLGNVTGDLIERLQDAGGAVALQSTLDAAIASEISNQVNELFSGRGPRANSPERKAAEAVEQARQEVEAARARVEATRADAERVVQSEAAIARYTESLGKLREQLQDAEARSKVAESLQADFKQQQQEFDLAKSRRDDLEKADKQITDVARQATELSEQLKPAKEGLEGLRKSLEEAAGKRKRCQAALDEANQSVDAARLAKDLADLQVSRFGYERDLSRCTEALKKIHKSEAALADLDKRLARLPKIGTREMAALRKSEQAVVEARSTLAAIATDVEIVECADSISVNGKSLQAGQRQGIDEPAEVRIGDHTWLRIIPGGGKGLEEARQDLSKAEGALKTQLQSLGLDSVEAAAEAQAEVNQLNADLQSEKKGLEALSPEDTHKNHDRLSRELETVRGRLEALGRQVADPQVPDSLEAAEILATETRNALEKAINESGKKRDALTAATEHVESLETDTASREKRLQADTAKLADLQTELRVLTEAHGSEEKRATRLDKAATALASAEKQMTETREKLDALDPDQLASDRERFGRSIEEGEKALRTTRDDRAAARGRLESDGRDDPQELLAMAEARLQSAQDALAREKRVGEAITLLNKAYTEEQASLSGQFSKPLADRITVYLQALFGKSARAQVTFQDNQLTGIQLSRESATGTFSFDSLSGGTREQVGAAVRLASAELLADKHDGALPVVFDDAFAYSDPTRVQELQRMLDQAARSGLQVIILSCNPADYAGLGAREVTLG